jgi:predicted HAD superfamily Cof-like phosphohydrolase
MNKHLKLVREFHNAFSFPQAEHGENVRLSEMDIILRQALLMEEGSELLRAIKAGDMVEILARMIDLAYCALGAIAVQGAEVSDRPVSWQHDGFVISLMRLFSGKINNCVSGNPDNYSEVYCLCVYLSRSFINADFDKAFQMVHDSKMSRLDKSGNLICENAEEILKSKFFKTPDLSDCLYE